MPSVSMARLLPLAVRVDPDRSSEYLWRAIAARPPRAAGAVHWSATLEIRQHYLVLAQLAALVARYDREAAETIFAPVAEDAAGPDRRPIPTSSRRPARSSRPPRPSIRARPWP